MKFFLPFALVLAGCSTSPAIAPSSDWKEKAGQEARLEGILLYQDESTSDICPKGQAEDVEGCMRLASAVSQNTPLRQLHAKCVIAQGITSALPADWRGYRIGLRGEIKGAHVRSCDER